MKQAPGAHGRAGGAPGRARGGYAASAAERWRPDAAPEGISIYREEIWLAVMEENRAAAEANVDALPAKPPADAPEQP